MSKTNPFDFVNAINTTKKNLIAENPHLEGEYNPFIVNRALSYHIDTIHVANIMNINNHISNKMQFDFLINIVRPRKRFAKWIKPDKSKDLDAIVEFYNCSYVRAKEYLEILSDNDLTIIKTKLNKGGKK